MRVHLDRGRSGPGYFQWIFTIPHLLHDSICLNVISLIYPSATSMIQAHSHASQCTPMIPVHSHDPSALKGTHSHPSRCTFAIQLHCIASQCMISVHSLTQMHLIYPSSTCTIQVHSHDLSALSDASALSSADSWEAKLKKTASLNLRVELALKLLCSKCTLMHPAHSHHHSAS